MRINKPILAKVFNESTLFLSSLLTENEIQSFTFKDELIEGFNRDSISIENCVFNNCNLLTSRLYKAQFCDVIFKNCNLSNLDLSECNLCRVEFIECKLTGTNLTKARINHVTFANCKSDYILFSGSKCNNVAFIENDLEGGAFDNCTLTNTYFIKSKLVESEFYYTNLKGIDLSDCDISAMRISNISSHELKGAVITYQQAAELAKLLGVIIKE